MHANFRDAVLAGVGVVMRTIMCCVLGKALW